MLLAVWAMVFAAEMPIRQAYLNDMIPSRQRATVLSFDSLMGSSGGVVIQPVLGRAADVYSYSTSLVIGAAIQLVAVPFLVLEPARRLAGGQWRRRWRPSLRRSRPALPRTRPPSTYTHSAR